MLFNLFAKPKQKGSNESVGNKFSNALSQLFTHKKLDATTLEELEELLIVNDVGVEASSHLIAQLKNQKFEKNIDENSIRNVLAKEIENILQKCQKGLQIKDSPQPQVIIFNGVNGVGKTTTIGKLATKLQHQNKRVLIAACDTFRSAAVEQLSVWADRVGCEIVEPQKDNEDPAAVAYRALTLAKEKNIDVVLIDTAGRLQNKQNLMDELKKINQVLKKIDASAPHENILVLDATTGQNARNQLEIFNNIVGITGLIITKLDGTARGGIVINLAQNFSKPIYAIGVGEKIDDLQEFNATHFTHNLLGL